MIWLQSPPWARWIASVLIAAGAVWVEVRPEPTVAHPFAIEDIAPGMVIDETNTEPRPIPVGTFATVEMGSIAVARIPAGDPVLWTALGEAHEAVPEGWWMIEATLPRTASRGDAARLVLLDGGMVVEGVVVTPAIDDPLGSGVGMIAVEPERAAEAAQAVAEGRAAVMISAG